MSKRYFDEMTRMKLSSGSPCPFKVTKGGQLPQITMAYQFDCFLGHVCEYVGISRYGSSAVSTIHDTPIRVTRIQSLFSFLYYYVVHNCKLFLRTTLRFLLTIPAALMRLTRDCWYIFGPEEPASKGCTSEETARKQVIYMTDALDGGSFYSGRAGFNGA